VSGLVFQGPTDKKTNQTTPGTYPLEQWFIEFFQEPGIEKLVTKLGAEGERAEENEEEPRARQAKGDEVGGSNCGLEH